MEAVQTLGEPLVEVGDPSEPAAEAGADTLSQDAVSGLQDSFLRALVEDVLQESAARPLERLLKGSMERGENGRLEIVAAGRFEGSRTGNLLAYAKQASASGALLIAERDEERVLYFSAGSLVGAASTVLFETLGRVLYQAEVVTHEDSRALVDAEEQLGPHALLLWLSSDQLTWAVERRLWDVVAAACLIKRGHFLFVEGEPVIEGPTVYLDPVEVALEGDRRREAWRNGGESSGSYVPPTMSPPPAAIRRRAKPIDVSPDVLRMILARIRDAEASTG